MEGKSINELLEHAIDVTDSRSETVTIPMFVAKYLISVAKAHEKKEARNCITCIHINEFPLPVCDTCKHNMIHQNDYWERAKQD